MHDRARRHNDDNDNVSSCCKVLTLIPFSCVPYTVFSIFSRLDNSRQKFNIARARAPLLMDVEQTRRERRDRARTQWKSILRRIKKKFSCMIIMSLSRALSYFYQFWIIQSCELFALLRHPISLSVCRSMSHEMGFFFILPNWNTQWRSNLEFVELSGMTVLDSLFFSSQF